VGDKTFEHGEVSIEHKKDDKSIHYLIFRNSVKRILYQGLLLSKVSNFGSFNKRNDCLQVAAFMKKEATEEAKTFADKYNKDICKIMVNPECSLKSTKIVKIFKKS
jgi:hypothetical protein